MENLIRLVFVGQSGSGKSRLINTLGKMAVQRDGVPEENVSAGCEPTYGCRYLHANIDYKGEDYNLRMVDTPGFFQDGVTKASKCWRDMAEAIHKSGMKVNIFVIVLKASEVIKSKEVVQRFVEFFGARAPLNSVVVFTDTVEDTTTEREVSFKHGEYLERHMKKDYPILLWKNDENESSFTKLMELIKKTSQEKPYEANHFSEAQMEYTKKWILSLQKTKLSAIKPSSNDELLLRNGIPDVLVINFLTEDQKTQLVKFLGK